MKALRNISGDAIRTFFGKLATIETKAGGYFRNHRRAGIVPSGQSQTAASKGMPNRRRRGSRAALAVRISFVYK
jgi:hypothetical protein